MGVCVCDCKGCVSCAYVFVQASYGPTVVFAYESTGVWKPIQYEVIVY